MSEHTRQRLVADLQTSQQQVVDVLAATEEIQDWQREPVEWSFRRLAAHLAAVERQCHFQRIKTIAEGNEPRLHRYNELSNDASDRELHASLRQWIYARQELLDFVNELDDNQLHNIGIHEKIGPITVLEALQEVLDQDRGNFRHVCQLIVDYYEEA